MKEKLSQPRLIAFEVTQRCRLNCRHCRANASRTAVAEELSTEQCKKIIKSIADYKKSVIIFTGGEPLERDDIYELIEYCRELGLPAVMATCGFGIDAEVMGKLKRAGIMAMSFSLDGASAGSHDEFRGVEGAYGWAIAAAKCAKDAGVRFQINTTISKLNIDEIVDIEKKAEQIGAYCFNPFILVPTGRGGELSGAVLDPDEYKRVLELLIEIKERSNIEVRVTCGPQFARLCRERGIKNLSGSTSGCMGGRGFGFISHKGDVQTCGFLQISAGNLVENGYDFRGIWQGSEFLNDIRSLSYKGRCGKCGFVGICGGCRARAYTMTGDYMGQDPVCFWGGDKG